jgi:Interleukin-like EMT inducer
MATYINNLHLSTALIGVTRDEASRCLTVNAKNALAAIGVHVTSLADRGKVAFVAQKGQPAMSVSVLAPAGGNNLKINVIARGLTQITYSFLRTLVTKVCSVV